MRRSGFNTSNWCRCDEWRFELLLPGNVPRLAVRPSFSRGRRGAAAERRRTIPACILIWAAHGLFFPAERFGPRVSRLDLLPLAHPPEASPRKRRTVSRAVVRCRPLSDGLVTSVRSEGAQGHRGTAKKAVIHQRHDDEHPRRRRRPLQPGPPRPAPRAGREGAIRLRQSRRAPRCARGPAFRVRRQGVRISLRLLHRGPASFRRCGLQPHRRCSSLSPLSRHPGPARGRLAFADVRAHAQAPSDPGEPRGRPRPGQGPHLSPDRSPDCGDRAATGRRPYRAQAAHPRGTRPFRGAARAPRAEAAAPTPARSSLRPVRSCRPRHRSATASSSRSERRHTHGFATSRRSSVARSRTATRRRSSTVRSGYWKPTSRRRSLGPRPGLGPSVARRMEIRGDRALARRAEGGTPRRLATGRRAVWVPGGRGPEVRRADVPRVPPPAGLRERRAGDRRQHRTALPEAQPIRGGGGVRAWPLATGSPSSRTGDAARSDPHAVHRPLTFPKTIRWTCSNGERRASAVSLNRYRALGRWGFVHAELPNRLVANRRSVVPFARDREARLASVGEDGPAVDRCVSRLDSNKNVVAPTSLPDLGDWARDRDTHANDVG